MMNTNDIYVLYALLVSNALLLAAAAIAVLRLQKLIDKDNAFWKSPTGAAIQGVEWSTDQVTRIVDQRLLPLLRVIDELSSRHKNVNARKSGELLFDNAVRMAKHGASIEDLTRSCGLSRGEAQLITRVHANRAALSGSA